MTRLQKIAVARYSRVRDGFSPRAVAAAWSRFVAENRSYKALVTFLRARDGDAGANLTGIKLLDRSTPYQYGAMTVCNVDVDDVWLGSQRAARVRCMQEIDGAPMHYTFTVILEESGVESMLRGTAGAFTYYANGGTAGPNVPFPPSPRLIP